MSRFIKMVLLLFLILVGRAEAQIGLPFNWDKLAVLIERFDSSGKYTVPHGTGFFVYDDSTNSGPFLVTNRHILKGRDSILMRFYNNAGLVIKTVSLRDRSGHLIWKSHPDTNIDVAAFPITTDAGSVYYLAYWRFRNLPNLETGEDIFFFGYPLGVKSSSGHITSPVLRHGVVSHRTPRPTVIGYDEIPMSVILIDGFSFGGNSGSPVLTKSDPFLEAMALNKIDSMKSKANLVGIIFGHVGNYRELVLPGGSILGSVDGKKITIVIPPDTILVEENTGLAKAFPAERIRETVEQFRSKR